MDILAFAAIVYYLVLVSAAVGAVWAVVSVVGAWLEYRSGLERTR